MPSFSIALTGLQADSVSLNTIGNNLANLNTTAFKDQNVQFADMFYQNIGISGSNSPLQVGIGTRVQSIGTNFAQGNLTSTSNTADMALNGNGFFIVNRGGVSSLTRTGSFQLSASGVLETADGETVMGYPVVNGAVNTNASLQAMSVPTATTQLPSATQNFSFTASLDSTASVGTSFSSSEVMYDSLGESHNVGITFTKTGSNTWNYTVGMPGGDASSVSGNTGTLTFNADGTLASPSSDVSGITFAGLSDNASPMTLSWKLHDANGNGLITQSAGTSSTNASSQDGYTSGTYEGFAVDSSGVMSATYSNGQMEILGQIAIATVDNQEGLTRNGSNTYSVNGSTGTMNIGVANAGGRGQIDDSSLEQSNVDISTEFSNLIVAQRAFEANSKTVTAFDTVTQDTINMIR